MSQRFLRGLGAAGLLLALSGPVYAAPQVLHLLSKDPHTWVALPSGPFGTLNFDPQTNSFTFSAERLAGTTAFALVQHQVGEKRGRIITDGISDEKGVLTLAGQWHSWQGKFWLVLTHDIRRAAEGDRLISWHPQAYLFEERVLMEGKN